MKLFCSISNASLSSLFHCHFESYRSPSHCEDKGMHYQAWMHEHEQQQSPGHAHHVFNIFLQYLLVNLLYSIQAAQPASSNITPFVGAFA